MRDARLGSGAMRWWMAALGASVMTGAMGCGGTSSVPTMEGREGMLSQTAVAQKCKEAAEEHLKPFVVEWDATDLASFEAKASEGTILVRYEGCKLVPLYECSASRRFGSYGQPHFTSGTTQGFDIKNEGELYTKIPLGAAKLSANIEAGEALHLEYFVSGVATSSRDSVYQGEIQNVAGCDQATHYVWAYNLGAFELSSKESLAGGAEIGIQNAGIGGSRRKETSQVGNGGDIKSCSTQEQRACRVPIRLTLRALQTGQHPSGPMASGGSPGAPGAPSGNAEGVIRSVKEQVASAETVAQLLMRAHQTLIEKRDGKACMDDYEEAFRLDPRQRENPAIYEGYLRCKMRAGHCSEGTKDFRAHLAAEDTKRLKTDEKLDEEARREANSHCPAHAAENDADYVLRAARDVRELSQKDGDACKKAFENIANRYGKLTDDRKNDFMRNARADGDRMMQQALSCVAKTKSCDAAKPLFKQMTKLTRPNVKDLDKEVERTWKRFAGSSGCQ